MSDLASAFEHESAAYPESREILDFTSARNGHMTGANPDLNVQRRRSRPRPVETREMLEALDAGGAHDRPDRARDLLRKGHRARPGRPNWTSSQLGGHIARSKSPAVACPSCLHRRPMPASWQFRQVLLGAGDRAEQLDLRWRTRAATRIWRSLIGPRSTGAASALGLFQRGPRRQPDALLAHLRAGSRRPALAFQPTARRLRASAQGQA